MYFRIKTVKPSRTNKQKDKEIQLSSDFSHTEYFECYWTVSQIESSSSGLSFSCLYPKNVLGLPMGCPAPIPDISVEELLYTGVQESCLLYLVSGSHVFRSGGACQSLSLRPSLKHVGTNLQALLTLHFPRCSSWKAGLSHLLQSLCHHCHIRQLCYSTNQFKNSETFSKPLFFTHIPCCALLPVSSPSATEVEAASALWYMAFSWQKEGCESFCLDKMYIMCAHDPLIKASHKTLPTFFLGIHPRLQLSEVTWHGQQMGVGGSECWRMPLTMMSLLLSTEGLCGVASPLTRCSPVSHHLDIHPPSDAQCIGLLDLP